MNQAAAKRPMVDTIRIQAFSGNGPAGEWELKKTTVTLGRVSTNDICLNDKKVSRNHATIEAKPEGLFVRDLGSSNGTWVNGQKVSESFIKDLDVVVIAGFRLQITLEKAVAPWDDKTAADANDHTPAEDDNVIPMRGKSVMPGAPSAEKSVRTEVVEVPKMEAAAKNPPAAPIKSESRPAAQSRPAVMYVGGKRVVSKPAPMAKTNAAPKTEKVVTPKAPKAPKVAGEKKPMSKGMKIALVLGGLFIGGSMLAVVGGGGAMYYFFMYKPAHTRHITFTPSSTSGHF